VGFLRAGRGEKEIEGQEMEEQEMENNSIQLHCGNEKKSR